VNKKTFTILLVIFFAAIAAFHFTLNFSRRIQTPSEEWSKEVLISEGNVLSNPSLINYKNNFVVAHSDGDKIKILSVDKLGKKLNEKTFNAKGSEPLSTNVVTDGKEIYLYWTISEAGKDTIYNLKLDDKFDVLKEDKIENSNDIVQAGENAIVINYNDKIELTDFSLNKSFSVPVKDAQYLVASQNKAGYVISFKEKGGDFKYFTLINGETSSIKKAGSLEETTSIVFINSILIADDNFGYFMIEYRSKGDYGGTKLIKFSLKEEGKYEAGDFRVNDSKVEVMNLSPYYTGGGAKFLAKQERAYDKKNYYDDIVEYDMTNGGEFIPLSRSKELSIFSAAVDDYAVFCDSSGKDNFNVYIASKNEEFKKLYNNIRGLEVKLASIDTISGLLYSFVYIIPYGALWVIPSIGIISIYSILEYKLSSRKKKVSFALVYLVFFIFKSIGVHSVSYKRFGNFMPNFMSFEISLIFSLVISLLCGIYAYSKYIDGLENNVGAMSLTMPLICDSILTLMVLVPFIV
jgi:hypothetical protein